MDRCRALANSSSAAMVLAAKAGSISDAEEACTWTTCHPATAANFPAVKEWRPTDEAGRAEVMMGPQSASWIAENTSFA